MNATAERSIDFSLCVMSERYDDTQTEVYATFGDRVCFSAVC